MRLTPAQIAIHLICGSEAYPRMARLSLKERLEAGHQQLCALASVDFGYDLERWHSYMREWRIGGYTWHRAESLPRIMKAAKASEEWRRTVYEIEREMPIPEAVRFVKLYAFADGGTISFEVVTELGHKCHISLNRSLTPDFSYKNTGRLMFNGRVIEVRSEEEQKLLRLLKSLEEPSQLEDARDKTVAYLESQAYVDFMKEHPAKQ